MSAKITALETTCLVCGKTCWNMRFRNRVRALDAWLKRLELKLRPSAPHRSSPGDKKSPEPSVTSEEFTCEVCGGTGVRRVGNWDHCPKGHTYVGKRADL